MMRDQPMNGTAGRARTMAGIRRRQLAAAESAGIDTTNRAALGAYLNEQARQMMLGIGDRARCRCGGPRHDVITKTKGI